MTMSKSNRAFAAVVSALASVAFAMMAASLALGFVVGYLAAQSGGEDVGVLSQLLPPFVASVGLVLFSGFTLNGHFTTKVVPCLSVFCFSVSLLAGFLVAETTRKRQAANAAAVSLTIQMELQQQRFRLLRSCSQQELQLKEQRRIYGLSPLRDLCGPELESD